MSCGGPTRRGGAPPVDISSHLIQRMLGLPPPATRDLVIERDLPVPMTDGAVLLADRWAPRAGSRRATGSGSRSPAAPFPRYARNPGTGGERATATTLRAADQEVYHDRAHPSAIILPVRQAR